MCTYLMLIFLIVEQIVNDPCDDLENKSQLRQYFVCSCLARLPFKIVRYAGCQLGSAHKYVLLYLQQLYEGPDIRYLSMKKQE